MSMREASEMKRKWRTASVHTENTRWGNRPRENMKCTRGCMRKHTRRNMAPVFQIVPCHAKRASVLHRPQYCNHVRFHVGCPTVSPWGYLLKFCPVNYTSSCCRRKLCPRVREQIELTFNLLVVHWVLFIHLQSLSFDRWRRLKRKLTVALTDPLLDYSHLKSPSWSRWSLLTAVWSLSAETRNAVGRVRKQVMSLIISISKNQSNVSLCSTQWTQSYWPELFCLRLPALCLMIITGKVFFTVNLHEPCIYPHHINPTNEVSRLRQDAIHTILQKANYRCTPFFANLALRVFFLSFFFIIIIAHDVHQWTSGTAAR